MERINIKDISLEWYVDWYKRNYDLVNKRRLYRHLSTNGDKLSIVIHLINKFKNVDLIVIEGSEREIIAVYNYVRSHSIKDLFKHWNHAEGGE